MSLFGSTWDTAYFVKTILTPKKNALSFLACDTFNGRLDLRLLELLSDFINDHTVEEIGRPTISTAHGINKEDPRNERIDAESTKDVQLEALLEFPVDSILLISRKAVGRDRR